MSTALVLAVVGVFTGPWIVADKFARAFHPVRRRARRARGRALPIFPAPILERWTREFAERLLSGGAVRWK